MKEVAESGLPVALFRSSCTGTLAPSPWTCVRNHPKSPVNSPRASCSSSAVTSVEELHRSDVTDRVRREVAEGAHRPVNVLQAPLEVARRPDAEAALHAGVPRLRQVTHRELAREQLLLQLIAQHDV